MNKILVIFLFASISCSSINEKTEIPNSPMAFKSKATGGETLVILPILNTEDGSDKAVALAQIARSSGLFKKVIVGDDLRQGDIAIVGRWNVKWKPLSVLSGFVSGGVGIPKGYETWTTVHLQILKDGRPVQVVAFKESLAIVKPKEYADVILLLEPIHRDLERAFHYATGVAAKVGSK